MLAARAAAYALEPDQATSILEQAHRIFGPLPQLVATHIHILRQYRNFNAAQSLIASAHDQMATNFSLWLEGTSLLISLGEFALAEQLLQSTPAKSKKEMARTHLLRARISEGRRHHENAIAYYQGALTLDPNNAAWFSDMARACLLRADIEGAQSNLRASFERDGPKRIAMRKSFNTSQHHIGQLIDEFALDSGLLAKLIQIIALPEKQQIEQLRRLVCENTDYTASALLLLLAMKKAGDFSSNYLKSFPNPARRIPLQIAQYWHSEVLPEDVGALMRTWRETNRNYTHIVFTDASAEMFLRSHCTDEVSRAFGRAQKPPQRADILRLGYLASQGGFFVDADDRCLADVDSFVPPQAEFVGYQDYYGAVGTNFVGAVPKHPVITLALEKAASAINRGDHDTVWLSTGPGLLTRAFAEIVLAADDWLSKVSLFDLWEIQRVVGFFCPARYKQVDHAKIKPLSSDPGITDTIPNGPMNA